MHIGGRATKAMPQSANAASMVAARLPEGKKRVAIMGTEYK
jgi:hypothetical protein